MSGFTHFLDAQEAVYDVVLRELAAGQKRSHWMWFIFPQVQGLGHSAMAYRFGIESLAQAQHYLEHPVLGKRLVECTRLVLAIEDRGVDVIFGYPDNLKFRSSMTLFALAAPEEPLFMEALRKYFSGEKDPRTLELLMGTKL